MVTGMDAGVKRHRLLPLGTLAPAYSGDPYTGENIDRTSVMPLELRGPVAGYLSACPSYLPWMEYTRDVIGDRFGVPGDAAIHSDGTYYWRADAVEYIREYGIPVPEDAIRLFESRNWQPPELSPEESKGVYLQIMAMFTRKPGEGIVISKPTKRWDERG